MEANVSQRRMKSLIIPTFLLLLQLLFGAVYIAKVPLWMPSDERAHMRYILDLAETGKLPVMQVEGSGYEAHQPPLYYSVGAVVENIFLPQADLQTAGFFQRSLCLVMFLASSIIFWAILSRMDINLKESIFAFYSLNPAMLGICASISNDSLSYLLCMLWVLLLCSRKPFTLEWKDSLLLGFITGLCMLCKLTCAPFAILSAVFAIRRSPKLALINWLLIGLPIVLMLAPWIAHNFAVYGHATATGELHDSVPTRDLFSFNYKSTIAYHFLPTEFWLNQVKLPLALQAFVALLFGAGVIGAVRLFWQKKTQTRNYQFDVFCAATYLTNFCPWFLMSLLVHAGAVRWVFGAFFAFSTLFCEGLCALLPAKITPRQFTTVVVTLLALSNAVIIVFWLPALTSKGLVP